MKDVVVLAGGNRKRGLRLRDKLTTEQQCVRFCQSLKTFSATTSREEIAAVFLLFPDELGIVDQLFANGIKPYLAGGVPVVFISSSPAENDRARALQYKADEFLIEPVSADEIVTIITDSVHSRLQRDNKHILKVGDLVLNKETLVVTWRNKTIQLYPLQVHILEFLMLNPRRPISRTELLTNVWNENAYIDNRTIDRNIKRIRDAFKRKARNDPIQTVRSVGYLFNDQFGQLSSLSGKGRS
jgi:DNA-binding response OmpR family regulator